MNVANIPVYPFIVIASLITILGGFALQRFIAFQNASLKFRETIITELGSIYPNPTWKIGTATVCCFAYDLHSYKIVAVPICSDSALNDLILLFFNGVAYRQCLIVMPPFFS